MRQPVKGDIVKTDIKGEDVWLTIMGTHNSGGLQARIETHLENEEFKVGDMVRIEREKITKILEPTDDD